MPTLSNISQDVTLVLTASVDPKSMPGVSRPDPHAREDDYVEALRYYVTRHPALRRIIFIENSGWPLDRLRRTVADQNPHGKEVEFISLSCNDFPRELGKSYGEMLLMDRGLEQSSLAKRAKFLAKITGRNYVMNLTALLERLRGRDFELCVDLRDHGIYEALRLPADGRHGESRLLVFTPVFYDRAFRGQYVRLNDAAGYTVEVLIYQVAKDPAHAGRVIRRFPIEPDFRGLAGHLNKDYGSAKEVLKRRVRGALRRVAPWLHV